MIIILLPYLDVKDKLTAAKSKQRNA